jgi:Tol biopolymer transport system component
VSTAQRAARAPREGARTSPGGTGRPQAAAVLALVGLIVAAIATTAFLLGSPNSGTRAGEGQKPLHTSNPSVIVTPPPSEQVPVKGTLLVVKAGRVWSFSGTNAPARVGDAAFLSSPAWSPDGAFIYAVQEHSMRAQSPYQGRDERYTLRYPEIIRMKADGSGARVIHKGLYSLGGGSTRMWFTWLLQPDVSPDGKRFALISDAPQPFQRDPTLSLLPTAGGKVTNLNVPEQAPLGHSDPAWSPDGTTIAFTRNLGEEGSGEPRIALYNVRTRVFRDLSKPGYAQASWSPDGRYLAAVRTDGHGRDAVILDARNGTELARLTRNGAGFAPTWSPDGTQIAYLSVGPLGIDLRLITLASGSGFQVASDKPVTKDGQIDGSSPPAWFIPANERG